MHGSRFDCSIQEMINLRDLWLLPIVRLLPAWLKRRAGQLALVTIIQNRPNLEPTFFMYLQVMWVPVICSAPRFHNTFTYHGLPACFIFIFVATDSCSLKYISLFKKRRMMSLPSAEPELQLETVRTQEDLTELEETLFDILKNALQPPPTSEPAVAAQKINELVPSASSEDENANAEEVEGFLWSLWGLVIETIKLVPHQHPGQTQMVDLIESMTQVSERTLTIWGVRSPTSPALRPQHM